jgi:hypothetical protein
MPQSTDLVTDLPADFETFGQAVATSMADLLGGTTGQVLSKASNTDMDFTWVAQDDSNAIQNAIVDAKGDLIAASAADTPARLAVGGNTAPLVADSTTATGLRWDNDEWTAYTPTWSSTGTAPTLGNGVVSGRYKKRGKVIHFTINFGIGSTSTIGSGQYFFSLPENAKYVSIGLINCTGYYVDTSAGNYYHLVADSFSGAGVLTMRTYTTNGTWATLDTWSSSAPAIPAVNDYVQLSGTYEVA